MRYYVVCAGLSVLWGLIVYLAGSFVAAGFDLRHDWFGPGRFFAVIVWAIPTLLMLRSATLHIDKQNNP